MRARLQALVPEVAKGLRAALATVGPMYLSEILHQPDLRWVALGGWLGSLADPGGARLSRARVIAAFAVFGGLAVSIGGALTAPASVPTWTMLSVLAVMAFGTSLLRAVGGSAGTVGTSLLVAICMATSVHGASPMRAGPLFALGASWAVLLSSVVWPVWTHAPVRRAIAHVFKELANYAGGLERILAERVLDLDDEHGRLIRAHHRALRLAIEKARTVILTFRSRRLGESSLGSNLRMLMGEAEAQLASLVAATSRLDSLPPLDVAELRRALAVLTNRWESIEYRLLTFSTRSRSTGDEATADEAGEGTPSSSHGLDSVRPSPARASSHLRVGIDRLLDGSIAALTLSAALDTTPSAGTPKTEALPSVAREGTQREGFFAVREALTPKSPFFQHALRVAGTLVVAQLVGQRFSPQHVSWVTITSIAVLQPYPGSTVTRAFERTVGTTAGSIAALAVMSATESPFWLTLIMFPLSAAAVVTRSRSQRLFTFFLTPVFVLFANQWQFNWWAAVARVGDVLLGGGIALMTSLAFIPSWERRRLVDTIDGVLSRLDAYAESTFDAIEGAKEPPPTASSIFEARRELGLALEQAELSLERMLAEPRRARMQAEDAVLFITYVRRLSAALTSVVDVFLHLPSAGNESSEYARPPPETMRILRGYVHRVLERVRVHFHEPTREAPEAARDEKGERSSPAPLAPPSLEFFAPWDWPLGAVVRTTEVLASLGRSRRHS